MIYYSSLYSLRHVVHALKWNSLGNLDSGIFTCEYAFE